jgi:hypothetical protein
VRRVRRDTNHAAIADALRKAGRSVLDLSAVGGGCPDMLVGWGLAHMVLLEIKFPRTDRKSSDHPVTENQVEWHRAWRGAPVAVVRSVAEALAACGVAQ